MICMTFKHHVTAVFTCAHLFLFLEILIDYNQNSVDIYNQIAIETFLHDSSMTQSE